MKNILLVIAFLCTTFLTACVDTEETIVINADNSGMYTLTIDMDKLAGMMKNFTNKDSDDEKEITDSTIYFKDLVKDAKDLTEAEKELYSQGTFRMKLDETKGELKLIANCPFKNLDQLNEIKKNLFDAMGKMQPDKKKETLEDDKEVMSKSITPFADQYSFVATPNSITNNIIDINSFKNTLAQDSVKESIQQMQANFGETKHKTILKLSKPIKKYKGPNAELSKDKKSISFLYSQEEMANNPAETTYSIEY